MLLASGQSSTISKDRRLEIQRCPWQLRRFNTSYFLALERKTNEYDVEILSPI